MNITRIRIEKLFGTLTHDIPLGDEGVTFIHGPNGCGKTTVLRLVHALLGNQLQYLKTVDFRTLLVTFSDGHSVLATRSVKKLEESQLFQDDDESLQTVGVDLSIALLNTEGKEVQKFDYSKQLQKDSRTRPSFSLSMIERKLPFLTRVGPQQWMDIRTNTRYGLEALIEKFGDRLEMFGRISMPTWLVERSRRGRVEIVRTQRLINLTQATAGHRSDDTKDHREVVEVYSSEIKTTIAKKLAESAIQSQAQDRSFPMRLINKDFRKDVPQDVFLETYRATEERAQGLMAAGLLDQAASIPLPKRKLTKLERDVLALYMSDFNEKLDAFGDLQRRIETLVDIVGAKLRRKKFHIDRNRGFVFETVEEKPRKLGATDLSSGEQHQLVLFYELIFASSGISLFLIDEPEISLHVEWQRAFIRDIEKVQKLTGASFLIATHSPQIINNRRDLAVPLDGGLPE
jgi:predicted ATP-binding protein involved in virulence